MIQNILHRVGGIHIYGIISICLFFSLFAGILFWAIRLKKPYLNSMRNLPLDERAPQPFQTSDKAETLHE